ncbi:MAG TPA: hypothetical protein VM074_12495 [Solimonas sp.]|nr:hypothetical protein [Solimonas sp.]
MKTLLAVLLAVCSSACVLIEDVPQGSGGGAKAGHDGPGGGDKAGHDVVICHKGKKTMSLPSEAAAAHLNHGDHYGAC